MTREQVQRAIFNNLDPVSRISGIPQWENEWNELWKRLTGIDATPTNEELVRMHNNLVPRSEQIAFQDGKFIRISDTQIERAKERAGETKRTTGAQAQGIFPQQGELRTARGKQYSIPALEAIQALGIQGGFDWEKIAKSPEDITTEEYSRLTDMLNARLLPTGTVMNVGNLGGVATERRGVERAPQVETEDMRQQALRRNYESARRTWNEGLMQRGAQFEQDLRLFGQFREQINKIILDAEKTNIATQELDPERRHMFLLFQSLPADTRRVFRQILDSTLGVVLRDRFGPARSD